MVAKLQKIMIHLDYTSKMLFNFQFKILVTNKNKFIKEKKKEIGRINKLRNR